jgi:hypothetical protein
MVWSTKSLVRASSFAVLAAVAWPRDAAAADELASSERLRGSYVRMPPVLASETPTVREGGDRHIIFLNRCTGGISIDAGWPDDNTVNRSGILGGTTQFPEYPFGDDSWNQVVTEAREIFAPFNVEITDIDPSPAPHDEAIICGSGALAGFSGAGGVAPFTCDVIPSPITFTFPESLGDDPRSIAEVFAQEAAHAWGLEHEYKCEDPMTYLYGCGEKTFQDGDYECGEYSPRACECGGATQNAYQYILDLFGSAVPDTQAPTVSITAPADGDVFAVGDDFDISVAVADDGEIALVELYLDGSLSSADMAEPYGPWPVIDAIAGSYEIHVVVTDAAGKETTSESVHFEVTEDGVEPDPSAGDDDGSDGGGDDSDGGEDGDGGDDDGGGTGEAQLPAGFGLGAEGQGCGCAYDRRSPWSAGIFVLLAAIRLRGRSRRTGIGAGHCDAPRSLAHRFRSRAPLS